MGEFLFLPPGHTLCIFNADGMPLFLTGPARSCQACE